MNNHCGNTIAYTTSPDWYKTTGLLTNIATNRCTMAEANAVFADAKAVAAAAAAAWSDIQQNGPSNEAAAAEAAAIAAQQASMDAAEDVLILVTEYCEPEQVIQNAQTAFITESTLYNELTTS
jgi:hypothetical protein